MNGGGAASLVGGTDVPCLFKNLVHREEMCCNY